MVEGQTWTHDLREVIDAPERLPLYPVFGRDFAGSTGLGPHHSFMRAVIQRVSEASVTIEGRKVSSIGAGLLVLLGVEDGDTAEDAEWLAAKVAAILRER